VLYQVVDHAPPIETDFLSDRQRGLQPAAHLPLEYWDGMSVFDTLAGARGLAKWRLRKGYVAGTFIAAILVEADEHDRWQVGRDREVDCAPAQR
jgi:hypothetical protein